MSGSSKIIGAIDLAIEGFITACLYPFMGAAVWRDFPQSPPARAFLEELKK